jgi:acyl-CoA reductase-like NAD-dependent aldehyde dehydrogenase
MDQAALDRAVEAVRAHRDEWAQLPVAARIALLRRCLDGYVRTADEVVSQSCRAKGHDPESVRSGEEWLSGPVAVVRQIRLFIETLSDIQRTGYPSLPRGAVRRTPTGELAVTVFPRSLFERVMYPGTRMDVWMQPDVTEATLRDTMASSYRAPRPPGKVVVVLGAGNVASIAPNDVLYKMLVEHAVVVLKMHPINAYLGPLLERAFEALIAPGYLRVVYGDVDEGQYLVHHPGVDAVHMTGSVAVHDRIVWGGDDRDAGGSRLGRAGLSGRPIPSLAKTITSELGCVTPTIVVPGRWSGEELQYHAENIATMVAHSASCLCVAAKVLVTWRGWPQRQAFLGRVASVLAQDAPRLAYYPGAAARYAAFTNRASLNVAEPCRTLNPAEPRGTPQNPAEPYVSCAMMLDLDPKADDLAFREEAWSPVLAETALDAASDADFLDAAVQFCNDRVSGTLSAGLLISPETRRRLPGEVDRAIADLRYGTVSINQWSAMNFVLGIAPWGAYPGHTLEGVGSGIGVVHNTLMFERSLKTVIWGPFTVRPKPPWFITHRSGQIVGRRIAAFEASPSIWKLPAIASAALQW